MNRSEAMTNRMKINNCTCHVQLTSAITPTAPQITAALAWAPLIPPNPDVTYTFPAIFPVDKYL